MASASKLPPPTPYIEFDEATHTYYVDGIEQVSVTQVLKLAGLIDDRWFTDYGRWRGSAVHKACQFYDEGDIDRRTLDPVVKPFVADWKEFRERTGFTPLEIEARVYDSLHQYCGRFDRFGYFATWQKPEDASTIVDLKAYPSGQAPDWARYQLAGYGRAKDPYRIFHRFAVVLTGGRGPVVQSYPTEEYVADVNEYLACVSVARLKKRLSSGGSQ